MNRPPRKKASSKEDSTPDGPSPIEQLFRELQMLGLVPIEPPRAVDPPEAGPHRRVIE